MTKLRMQLTDLLELEKHIHKLADASKRLKRKEGEHEMAERELREAQREYRGIRNDFVEYYNYVTKEHKEE